MAEENDDYDNRPPFCAPDEWEARKLLADAQMSVIVTALICAALAAGVVVLGFVVLNRLGAAFGP